MTAFLRFEPIFQERVWGGRVLETKLGRKLPGPAPYGESWEIVDRPEAQSRIVGGADAGKTLRHVIEERAAEVMGPRWPATRAFPILVKWLDCRERLSLQVHPPAAVAGKLGGEPKTENWYIAEAEPGAAVLAGMRDGVTVDEFARSLKDNTAEKLVRRLETRAGDSLLIHSGVIHAIDGGNLILEIQQNSDTTYRVYDWGRVGLDGKPRALHVEQSIESVRANTAGTPELVHTNDEPMQVLAECREFRITRRRLRSDETISFARDQEPRIVSVVNGSLEQVGQGVIARGENVLLPYAGDFEFTAADGDATVLVTDRFVQPAV
jgi:mannose-6-phosphate isomerase